MIEFRPKNLLRQNQVFGLRPGILSWITAEITTTPGEAIRRKRFLWKIYDDAGTFITTWTDVLSDPIFSIDLNGGFSELQVELARSESEYDEGVSVEYGNQLKLYVFDGDTDYSGTLIYSGILTRYVPSIVGVQERVTVSFLSYWVQLEQQIIESAGDTELTYTTQDPEAILQDALDKFTAAGGKLDYNGTSTDTVGATVTYVFNTNTYQEVLKKVLELSPADFYLRVGADDIIYYKQRSATADHTLTLGKEIAEYQPEKRIENVVNTIYFVGGGSPKLYKKYTAAGSITAYGTRAIKYIDERVTATGPADNITTRIFDALSEPEIRVTLKVMDNNGEAYLTERGYDIETLLVGQTVQILNATSKGNNLWDEIIWDTDSWDYDITNAAGQILQIMRVQYTPEYAIIELSNKQPNIIQRIEQINRQLIDSITADNPATPS